MKKKKTDVEQNCSQEQNSKLPCYDEAVSGAVIENMHFYSELEL